MTDSLGDSSYLRRRVEELRGEAARTELKGDLWRGQRRAISELQHLEAAADELEAEADAAEQP